MSSPQESPRDLRAYDVPLTGGQLRDIRAPTEEPAQPRPIRTYGERLLAIGGVKGAERPATMSPEDIARLGGAMALAAMRLRTEAQIAKGKKPFIGQTEYAMAIAESLGIDGVTHQELLSDEKDLGKSKSSTPVE